MLPIIAAAGIGLATKAGEALAGRIGTGLASAMDPASRAYRQQLKTDISDLKRNKLGLTEAEKRGMLAQSQRALQAQTASQEANLRRAAAAQGGFGRSGAMQQAIGTLGSEQREKMVEAAGRVDEMSQRRAQERFTDIMDRIYKRRAEVRQGGATTGQGATGTALEAAAVYPELKKKWMEKQQQDKEEALRLENLRLQQQQQQQTTGTVVPPATK